MSENIRTLEVILATELRILDAQVRTATVRSVAGHEDKINETRRRVRALEAAIAALNRICRECNGIGGDCDAGDDGRTVSWQCPRCFGSGVEPSGKAAGRLGQEGVRDPENPCEGFLDLPLQIGDVADCSGDGHYLCHKCCWLRPARPPAEGVE